MLIDSVFGTFTTYADAPILMPISEILDGMGAIELKALSTMNAATRAATMKLKKQAQGKSLAEIKKLNWDLAPEIAESLNVAWDKGYKVGSKHAITEMREAIPGKQNSLQYAKISDLIKQIFELKPFSVFDRPKAAVKKILSRNLLIAGDYAKDILARVKDNISQGMITQANGYTASPKEVNALLAETLNVSQSRAAMISRTETTNAYNESRVETFKQSGLATHCRFLAIADDRTTDICETRNGIVFPIAEAPKYQPALHVNCRSTISVLLPKINPAHQRMVDDASLDPKNRTLAPLPVGWR
jgi:SPP1 gp7 family putative phage head morphogenesis protein